MSCQQVPDKTKAENKSNMISYFCGKLVRKDPGSCVVDVHGVGMEIIIPRSTFESLGEKDTRVMILTHLHVREDALTLFGFSTEEERDLFRLLLSVTGIGPKLALSVISGYRIHEVYQYIAGGNESALSRIPGLGKKTVQRIIVDLKDKAQSYIKRAGFKCEHSGTNFGAAEEAVMALISLGQTRTEAEKKIQQALNLCGDTVSVEELVRTALLQKL
jgi:holliday junction DNA helicase RuvA